MRRVALLLRAVNVGGRKLAMAELRKSLAEAGFDAPETLLASGNAVVGTAEAHAAVEARAEAVLREAHGLPTEVLARDAGQLAAILAANPYPAMARDDPGHLVVFFLRGAPQAELSVLAPWMTAGETAAPGPGCLYIAYPAGIGTSKLGITQIERQLGVKGTARNWNTVGKLAARLA